MPERHTDGKVTYIHGAEPKGLREQWDKYQAGVEASHHADAERAAYLNGTPLDADMERWRKIQTEREQRTSAMQMQHGERVTLSRLEAGENDPALAQDISQQMRDAEILSCVPASDRIRIIEGFSPIGMPDEPSVEVYYGGPANGSMSDFEPDEYEVWGTSQKPSSPARHRLNWPLIWLWFCIIAGCATAWYLVVQILGATGLPEFLATAITTISSPTK